MNYIRLQTGNTLFSITKPLLKQYELVDLPNLCLGGIDVEGTGGEGTGLAETGGQASSQQLMPPTAPHHHFLLIYKRNTNTSAPKPAISPNRVLPSVPARKIRKALYYEKKLILNCN